MKFLREGSKNVHPLFVAAGAPGVGKSRILDEGLAALKAAAAAAASDDTSLREHLQRTADVRVTFRGFSEFSKVDEQLGGDGVVALCGRMLYTMFAYNVRTSEGTLDTWDDFRDRLLRSPGCDKLQLRTVLRVIRLALGKPEKWCVYLAVDESVQLQSLPLKGNRSPVRVGDVPVQKGGPQNGLEVVIGEIGKNMCQPEEGLLLIPFLAGQSVSGLDSAFRTSFYVSQFVDCSLLSFDDMYTVLDLAPIQVEDWQTHAPFVRAVADMGGNMRALEIFVAQAEDLALAVSSKTAKDLPLGKLYRTVVQKLDGACRLPHIGVCFELVRHAVLRLGVTRDLHVPFVQPLVPGLAFGVLESTGLVSIRDDGRLELPFVQFFRMVETLSSTAPYADCFVAFKLDLESDLTSWQSWEDFNVRYDALRLSLHEYREETIRVDEFFRGARLAPGLDLVHLRLPKPVIRPAYSAQQFRGKKDTGPLVSKHLAPHVIDWKSGKFVVRNGDSAPWADWFTFFPESTTTSSSEPNKLFVGFLAGQGKFSAQVGGKTLTGSEMAAEAAKVTTDCGDVIFGLFTNAKVAMDGDLPPNQVLVSQDEFAAYYGSVFASRARFAFGMSPRAALVMNPFVGACFIGDCLKT